MNQQHKNKGKKRNKDQDKETKHLPKNELKRDRVRECERIKM